MFFKLIIIANCLKSHLFHSGVYSKPQAAWLVGIKGILSFLNMILKKRGHCIVVYREHNKKYNPIMKNIPAAITILG